MPLAATPPALVKLPPAYKFLPDRARARIDGVLELSPPRIPPASVDQLVPSHLAIAFTIWSPASLKIPPA